MHLIRKLLSLVGLQREHRWPGFCQKDSGGKFGWVENHQRPNPSCYADCWRLGDGASPDLLAFSKSGLQFYPFSIVVALVWICSTLGNSIASSRFPSLVEKSEWNTMQFVPLFSIIPLLSRRFVPIEVEVVSSCSISNSQSWFPDKCGAWVIWKSVTNGECRVFLL